MPRPRSGCSSCRPRPARDAPGAPKPLPTVRGPPNRAAAAKPCGNPYGKSKPISTRPGSSINSVDQMVARQHDECEWFTSRRDDPSLDRTRSSRSSPCPPSAWSWHSSPPRRSDRTASPTGAVCRVLATSARLTSGPESDVWQGRRVAPSPAESSDMSRASRRLVPVVMWAAVSSVTVGAGTTSADVCPPTFPANAPVTFTDTTDAAGVDAPLVGMMGHASASGDVNEDGWQDLFVGTFADRPVAEYQFRGATGPTPDRLLLGGPSGFTPDPTFPQMFGRTASATSPISTVTPTSTWWSAATTATRSTARRQRSLLRNDGGQLSVATTLVTDLGARSIGVLDYNGDSRLDLFVTEDHWSGGTSILLPQRRQPAVLRRHRVGGAATEHPWAGRCHGRPDRRRPARSGRVRQPAAEGSGADRRGPSCSSTARRPSSTKSPYRRSRWRPSAMRTTPPGLPSAT